VSSRRILWFLIPAIVLALAVWYGLFAHEAPPGQPPLATMDVTALKHEFERASGKTRILLLLSPT
jgi:hypothetical protein